MTHTGMTHRVGATYRSQREGRRRGELPPQPSRPPAEAAQLVLGRGKIERFQQTMKKWLRGQPDQPSSIAELQALIDRFVEEYNRRRPHRALERRATPATITGDSRVCVPVVGLELTHAKMLPIEPMARAAEGCAFSVEFARKWRCQALAGGGPRVERLTR
jgi:hypothetical protein